MTGYYVTAGQGNGGPMVPCRDLEQAAEEVARGYVAGLRVRATARSTHTCERELRVDEQARLVNLATAVVL
jgi:hypothetical protein